MTFQFLCPQGHLLQGDEAHMGMECQCPQCGVAFIIPTIGGAQPAAAPVEAPEIELAPIPDDLDNDSLGSEGAIGGPGPSLGDLQVGDMGTELDEAIGALYHIPCPNGHELEVPVEMIGSRAQCPHCGAEFRLKRERSREYEREQEILDSRRAQFWFRLAIIAAGIVVVVLLIMIIATAAS